MSRPLIPIALFIVAVVFASTPADARRHGPPPDERLEQHLAELDLTPSQKEKVRTILDASRAERRNLRAQKRAAIGQMHSLLEQDPPDEEAILSQADKIGAIQTEAHKVMLRTLLQIREQLSPDQRRKLRTFKRRECSLFERGRERRIGKGANRRRGYGTDSSRAGPRHRSMTLPANPADAPVTLDAASLSRRELPLAVAAYERLG